MLLVHGVNPSNPLSPTTHQTHDRQQRLYIMTLGVQAAYRGRAVGA